MMIDPKPLGVLLIFLLVPNYCSGTAFYSLKFVKYDNKHGKDSVGDYCDSSIFGKTSRCDFYFEVDIQVPGVKGWISTKTGVYYEQDTVVFGNTIGSFSNPVNQEGLAKWPGYLEFKFRVTDEDHLTLDDHADYIHGYVRASPDKVLTAHVIHGSYHKDMTELTLHIVVGCETYYYGISCTKYCEPQDDSVNGHYSCTASGDKQCLPNWRNVMANCLEVDLCFTKPCQHGGRCTQTSSTTYLCHCSTDYRGVNCEIRRRPCEKSNLCQNGGICVDEGYTSSHCVCPPQWKGVHCESDKNECLSNPCRYNSTCINSVGDYSCTCSRGFTGRNCTINIDECAANTTSVCLHGGRCVDKHGSFECLCPPTFNGTRCENDVNECATNTTEMSSACLNNGTCHNYFGSFNCTCTDGFRGTHCEIDINECAIAVTPLCANNGTCENTYGGFVCSCPPGYTGRTCDEDENECRLDSKFCQNGGKCINTVGSAYCDCPITYTGPRCESDVNECLTMHPCQNNGTCTNLIGDIKGYSCDCEGTGYRGYTCSVDINECREQSNNDTCSLHGVCNNTDGSYVCDCIFPFTDDRCQTCNVTGPAAKHVCYGTEGIPIRRDRVSQPWIPVVIALIILLLIGIATFFVFRRRSQIISRLPASIKERIRTKNPTANLDNVASRVEFDYENPAYENDREEFPGNAYVDCNEFNNGTYVSPSQVRGFRDPDDTYGACMENGAYNPDNLQFSEIERNQPPRPYVNQTSRTSSFAPPTAPQIPSVYDDYNETQYASVDPVGQNNAIASRPPIPPPRKLPVPPREEREPQVYDEEEEDDDYGYSQLPADIYNTYSTIERKQRNDEPKQLAQAFDDTENFPPPPLPPRGLEISTPDDTSGNSNSNVFVMNAPKRPPFDDSIV